MKTLHIVTAITIAALAWPHAASTQSNVGAAVQFTEARKANATLMRQYSWTSRTEIMEGGEVKDIRIEQVNYDPGGQLQRTLLNDQGAALPFGFLRRAIAEHKRKELEEFLTGLRGLIEQYTLPTEGKVLDFMNRAAITGPDASGVVEMSGQSVVVPGDTMGLWMDARTRQIRRIQAGTYYQGTVVSVTAVFKTLPSGLTHMAYGDAQIPARSLSVQVQNFDYNRNN